MTVIELDFGPRGRLDLPMLLGIETSHTGQQHHEDARNYGWRFDPGACATVMTTITNDAWFGRTAAPFQHFDMAVFRAVENRVPIARAANTGVSGFIDANGRVLESSGIFTEAALTRTVTPSSGDKSFYTRYGDVFTCLCVFASILLLVTLPKRQAVRNRS